MPPDSRLSKRFTRKWLLKLPQNNHNCSSISRRFSLFRIWPQASSLAVALCGNAAIAQAPGGLNRWRIAF
jgi:hypothetical protein